MMKKFRMPLGFRFSPSDQELLLYMKLRAKGVSYPPWKDVVLERNLYDSQNDAAPWMLFTDDDPWQVTTKVDAAAGKINVEKILYVVTKLEKIGGKHTLRTVGSWTWDGSAGQSKIWNYEGEVMGFKRTFKLSGKGVEIVGNWFMYEYRLCGVSLQEIQGNDDFVICRIKWNYTRSMIRNITGTSLKVHESGGFGDLGKKRQRSDQEIPDGKRVCSRGTSSDLEIFESVKQESGESCGKSELCENFGEQSRIDRESSRFDEEIPIPKRACSQGISCSGIVLSINEVQEHEAICGNLSTERSRFDKKTTLLNKGIFIAERSLFLGTGNQEKSYPLESLSKENVRFDQANSSRNVVNFGSSCRANNGNACESSNIMQLVREDEFYFDVGDIVNFDNLVPV